MGLGLGTQSVLWSDPQVFATYGETVGNTLMAAVTRHALETARGLSFASPPELLAAVLPEAYRYACVMTGQPDLRLTFVLNALVPFDNAAWMLYARERRLDRFENMVGPRYAGLLTANQPQLGCIPLVSYGVPIETVERWARGGHGLLKIKIGSDPNQDGDLDKMLAWDRHRLEAIHRAVGDIETNDTESGHPAYYLDANGRYDAKDRLRRLLDHADAIGARDRILMIEEPFAENSDVEVGDLGVTIAADESAHSAQHVRERLQLGYGMIALKPIAKTLSMSLDMLEAAQEKGVPCFCADLTVNPILVEWNKLVAAHLPPLPGLRIGVFETNGDANYKHWTTLCGYHPLAGRPWTRPAGGRFTLDEDFYATMGGILMPSAHYTDPAFMQGQGGEVRL
jgi:L-alanine-DL-glutamate epimerase-like enolase superfamily enzyme